MRFAALGERKNPAVLFFHAMGVTGESSELVAKYLQERYFCILQTQANAYQSRHVPYSGRKQGRDRLRAGYVRDDLPGLQAGEGRLLFRKMQRDLIRLMHEPRIAYVSGGHLTTVLQAEKFIETIRAFLPSLGE